MPRKIKLFLWVLGIYITVAGLVTFALFIHAKSLQTIIWGTWRAQDAKQWHLVKEGADLADSINTSMKIVNYSFGWIQPFAMLSYHQHTKSADYYIRALRAKTFAFAPELFVGEKVEFEFIPKELKTLENGDQYTVNDRVAVRVDKNDPNKFDKKIINGRL